MRSVLVSLLAAGALLLGSAPARAQTDPRLVSAVRAAQEGRGDSARAEIQRLLAATPPTDSLYPQILYTQAMVAGSAGDMRRALQQVAIEHAGSPWADDALLRLVQMDYAVRNLESAARNVERLRLDFPATPLLAQAAYWAGRTYFDDNKPAAACRWLADGMAQAGNDIELQNQLGYLYQRCNLTADTGAASDTGGAAKPDTTSAAAPPAAPPATPAAGPAYRVQIAAVATQQAAEDFAARVRGAGFAAVTVREKGLYKVRAGEFATRAEAQAAVGRLKARLGGSPFVVAEP